MMASSDMERASRAIDPPRSAEAIASELKFCPIIYSTALSTTAPAWLRSSGDSFALSAMTIFLCSLPCGIASFTRDDAAPSVIVLNIVFRGLQRPHPGVKSAFRQQRAVTAAFGDKPVLQHDDLVGVDHRGKPMSDHQRGPAVRHSIQSNLNVLF